MSKNFRLGLALASASLVVFVSDARIAYAQRINIGGGNQNNRDRDKDQDDEREDEDDENKEAQRGNRSSRSGNRNSDQINQFFQRNQGGKSGQSGQGQGQGQLQGNVNQFRPDGRPGQFPEGGQIDLQKMFRPKEGSQNLRVGGWQGNRWQGSRDVENWSQVFTGGKQPFSSEWYQEHPKAWKYDNNKANIWVTASLPGVYSWLGWGNVPPQFNVNVGPTRHFDVTHYGEWYPLGVFSLMSGPGDMGTRVVQLAVDRHGHVAGNYYDLITDTNSSISGDVRRQSQRVRWSLNKNKFIRFEVPIYRLMQPYGYMTVQLPGGEQDWQFVRLEN